MKNGFNKFTEGVAWLQIAISPILIGIIVGIIVGVSGSPGFGIVIGLFGFIIGIFWATRISKKEGASHFISRTMATPELDESNQKNIFIRDIVCQVYAGEKSLQKIKVVLDEFVPNYESLNLDYTSKPDDEKYTFGSEQEMISYFIDTPNVQQTFYWNSNKDNPDKIMVGANITDDDQLIMSLTIDGTKETGSLYFHKLKKVLKSEIGVVSYVNPAEYEDGDDFYVKYAHNDLK